jgi:hypothetical protein
MMVSADRRAMSRHFRHSPILTVTGSPSAPSSFSAGSRSASGVDHLRQYLAEPAAHQLAADP